MKMNPTSIPILSQLYLPMIDNGRHKSQIKEVTIQRNKTGIVSSFQDFVAVEAPLQIEVKGKPVSITMRTPGDDVALALGFLFTEGLINDYNAIADVKQKDENTVDVFIPQAITIVRNNFINFVLLNDFFQPLMLTENIHQDFQGLKQHHQRH